MSTPHMAGLDPQMPLEEALKLACARISNGEPNVAIIDGNGRQIEGTDLVACCRGEKKLTDDLRAVSN
jgi:hypothetical protein